MDAKFRGSRFRLGRSSWVEYGTDKRLDGVVPPIIEASRSLPSDYKNIPRRVHHGDMGERNNQTVRMCLPFRDAMSEGIVIPLAFDLAVESGPTDSDLSWWWEPDDTQDSFLSSGVVSHNPAQSAGYYDKPIIKIPSPYFIRTSPDILALYQPLANREASIIPFSGLVNHGPDGYRVEVNFPCKWEGGLGLHRFSQGEPLVQVVFVPRKRIRFSKTVFDKSAEEYRKQRSAMTLTEGAYHKFWRGKRR